MINDRSHDRSVRHVYAPEMWRVVSRARARFPLRRSDPLLDPLRDANDERRFLELVQDLVPEPREHVERLVARADARALPAPRLERQELARRLGVGDRV